MKKLVAVILALALVLSFSMISANAEELKVYRTYQTLANEMETFVIQYTQRAKELDVLTNCIDGLLTNDPYGNLVPNAAKEYFTEDGGKTWTFKLNEGMNWVDMNGEIKAPVVAEDWLWGLEWTLNAAKNMAANVSMPEEMIVGAKDYYEYTKALPEDEAKALGLDKFLEMVGIAAPDQYTVVYSCTAPLSYFPTLATYNCLYPISGALLAELGVDGFFACDNTTMWYSGPYTITEYIMGNEKVYTKNPNYWNKDAKVFDEVIVKMVESATVAYQLFQTGELDYVALSPADLNTIYSDPSNEFYGNLVEARATKYAYSWKWNFNKLNDDGTPDTDWNTAIANENFRLAFLYGLDLTSYISSGVNFIHPLNCQNLLYTATGVATTTDGTDYTQLVLDELGVAYDYTTNCRFDAVKGAEYRDKAIEELTAAGVKLPVKFRWFIQADSNTAKDTADALAQAISDNLGGLVELELGTYMSSSTKEVSNLHRQSVNASGWGADFGDPINFLGQETMHDDNAYYANAFTYINEATDPVLIADYETYTQMVNDAKAITDDIDARLAAFAKAEAYFIQKGFTLPTYMNIAWELTCVNDFSKPYAAYGIQANRMVDWETNADIYTTEEYEAIKAAF